MRRTLATRTVTTLGVLALAAVVTGCAVRASEPGADPATELVCDSDSRQTATVALAAGEPGAETAEEAVRDAGMGVPAGQVELEDAAADAGQVAGLVRDGGVVVAEVTVLQTPDGWFLESVTTCG